MKLKDDSVDITKLKDRLKRYLPVIDGVCRKVLGYECVITSGNDGKHVKNSAHYDNRAIDVRTWTTIDSGVQIDDKKREELSKELSVWLPKHIVHKAKKDHIHIKTLKNRG